MTHAAKTAWRLSLLLPCVFAPPESAKPFLRGGAIVGRKNAPAAVGESNSIGSQSRAFLFLFLILTSSYPRYLVERCLPWVPWALVGR